MKFATFHMTQPPTNNYVLLAAALPHHNPADPKGHATPPPLLQAWPKPHTISGSKYQGHRLLLPQ